MKIFFALAVLALAFAGCKKNDSSSPVSTTTVQTTTSEAQLYNLGKNSNGFMFYKNSTDPIDKGAGSGHTQPLLRTRYNSVAAEYLDGAGKVKPGTVFRDSSLIVKELYTGNNLEILVFLFKKKGDANADANGWVWAELSPAGNTLYAVTNKGSGCVGCHSPGIDYTRMNDTHP